MSLNTLDPQQNKAASHQKGAALVMAGAGSGKTRVAVESVVRRIQEGVASDRILMLTFSRKAENEMRFRLKQRMEEEGLVNKVIVNTYHGFGWTQIQANPKVHGRRAGVSLMDDSDAKKKLMNIVKDHKLKLDKKLVSSLYEGLCHEGYFEHEHKVKALAWMNDLIKSHQQMQKQTGNKENTPPYYEISAQLWEIFWDYDKSKRQSNTVDYSDLLTLPVFACKNQNYANELADRFDFIVADEVQDTNQIQYELIQRLYPLSSIHSKGLMMVGDDDQSIYVWRGAKPENLINFKDQYQATTYPLERNYRCSKPIVESAGLMISNNANRLPKNPYSTNHGDSPVAMRYDTGHNMGRDFAKQIKAKIDQGVNPKDIAILYRNNAMSTFIESALISEGVPYHVFKGADFTKRVEIQMALAWVRLLINPSDDTAFAKLCQTLPGIGLGAINQAVQYAQSNQAPLIEGALYSWKGEKQQQAQWLATKVIELSQAECFSLGVWMLREEGANLGAWLKAQNGEDSKGDKKYNRQLEHLKLLTESIYARVGRGTGIDKWQQVMELFVASPDENLDKQAVTLSTIHRCKGLEFSSVYVFGMSASFFEGSKKTQSFMQDEDDAGSQNTQEARRLAYVAMTRAKHDLVIGTADIFHFGYKEEAHAPSDFLREANIVCQDAITGKGMNLFDQVSSKNFFQDLSL